MAQAQAATFTWEGTNRQGKLIRGEITAASIEAVKAELRKQGVTPKAGKVKRKGKSLFGDKGKKIKPCLLYTSDAADDSVYV